MFSPRHFSIFISAYQENLQYENITGEFAQMFQDVTGKRVRQGGERFFNCLNGIRRIHTCIPGEKRQNPMLRGLYPWWHWLLERENPRTLQVCT
ncbi:hypothetical protein C7K59_11870 [Escherichia coli]|nr:hypothetical protein C7K59_11870 [Escherichia coli]